MSTFEELFSIDVGKHKETKNGLSYLTWSWAWAELQKKHPEATYEIVKNESGLPYFESDMGIICYTRLTINKVTHEMWLPVMDGQNNAMKSKPYEMIKWKKKISVNAATMFDINKTIMRCLTKNIAMFGLGLYIYAGEDLPEILERPANEIADDFIKAGQECTEIQALRDYLKQAKALLKPNHLDEFKRVEAVYIARNKEINPNAKPKAA